MRMLRVYYVGIAPVHDARLGLDLHPGYAFDIPEHIALALYREECFRAESMGPRVRARPLPEITWYTAPPGEELLALDGVGKARADALVRAGVSSLEDLISLDQAGRVRLARGLTAVSPDLVEAWADQAKTIKEAM